MHEVILEPMPESVWRARHLVAQALQRAGCAKEMIDTVVLCTSELVTNVVRHARTEIGLGVVVRDGVVRVEVRDHDAVLPATRELSVDSAGGRGLHIVNTLTDAWGLTTHPGGGKTVWVQFRRRGVVLLSRDGLCA